MNVAWRHYRTVAAGAPGGAIAGIGRGYFKLGYYLYRALERRPEIRVVDVDAAGGHPKLVFHICPPHLFSPIPGKVNVLMSMWEGDALPQSMVAQLRRADWCVVPSRYCQRVWRDHGVEAAVVPLGVAEPYTQVDSGRRIVACGGRTLRYLWIGSKLGRKGWEYLLPAWRQVFGPGSHAELHIKTIRAFGENTDDPLLRQIGPKLILDERDLSEAEMLELYLSADVFVFPTMGEGFGLPALEAMASGCLVIAPKTTGLTEFVDEYTAILIALSAPVMVDYGAQYKTRLPTVEGLAGALRKVAAGWGTAPIESIRRTGNRNARRLTWDASAARLVEVLTAIAEKKGLPQEELIAVS